MFLLILIHRQ